MVATHTPACDDFYLGSVHPGWPDEAREAWIDALSEGNVEKVAFELVNVLEEVTMREHPIIGEFRRVLMESGAMASLMSGSGPTIFGLTNSREKAEKAAQSLSCAYPEAAVFIAPTTGRNKFQ